LLKNKITYKKKKKKIGDRGTSLCMFLLFFTPFLRLLQKTMLLSYNFFLNKMASYWGILLLTSFYSTPLVVDIIFVGIK